MLVFLIQVLVTIHLMVKGSKAVLEIRSWEVPFILEDSQIVGRLIYEKLLELPERSYGSSIGSNYQKQGLKLSKHFKQI